MAIIHVKSEEFDAKVLQSTQTVIVDFWATWCGPCRMLGPVLEELAQEHQDIVFAKVNVDEEPELAMQYGIAAIPAVYRFEDGKVVDKTVGYQDKDAMEEFIS